MKSGLLSSTSRAAPTEDRQWSLDQNETAALHRVLSGTRPAADLVDDRTWSDLELERVFGKLDNAVTPLGTQYLYTLLRTYEAKPEKLRENAEAWRAFSSSAETAAGLRKALAPLDRGAGANLAEFLFGPIPPLPRRRFFFPLIAAAALLCPLGIFFSVWFLWFTLALWSTSIFLHCHYITAIGRHAPALASLAILLECLPQIIGSLHGQDLPELKKLAGLAEVATHIRNKISWVFSVKARGDELMMILMDYLNVFCLFEVNACCRAIAAVSEQQAALTSIFRGVARLDAFQGLAASLSQYPYLCVAVLKEGRSFTLIRACHPLLKDPVDNSIRGTGNSLLLSGTNMAGKTTFMKTVAINVLLSQTVGICLAEEAVLPPARIKTLIERDETTAGNRSYFYFDAAELLRMIRDAESSRRDSWFFVDELFRGTNTVERVAASSAVLKYMTSRWMVIASTHDQEVIREVGGDFDSYHFTELITEDGARFDYRLHPGPCTSRNAIKLLALAGYPKEVTDMAGTLAGRPPATES
jgi:hypothetical protein